MSDVFISYSRRDIDFVRHLFDQLTARDREPWADWQDIPPTADWLAEIYHGIEAADSFLFIISPDSVASEICTLEIEHAVKHNKRLIPVVWKEVADGQAHASIQAHNWIFLREGDDFKANFELLINSLQTDLDYVREHTRLLRRAIDWHQENRPKGLALGRQELKIGEDWLKQGINKEPKPTQLHTEHLAFSRAVVEASQRRILIGIIFACICSFGGMFLAILQRQEAVKQKLVAENQKSIAENNARIATAKSLAALALTEMDQDPELSILLGLESIKTTYHADKTVLPISNTVLRQSILSFPVKLTLRSGDGPLTSANYHPDGGRIVTASRGSSVKVWDAKTGQLLLFLEGHDGQVNSAVYSPDGKKILTAGTDQTARIWDAETGEELLKLIDKESAHHSRSMGTGEGIISAVWSPSGDSIATGSENTTVKVWDAETGQRLLVIRGDNSIVRSIAYSPDGRQLVTGGEDGIVKVWDIRTGKNPLTLTGHNDDIWCVGWSPREQKILTASSDRTVRVWDSQTGSPLFSLKHDSPIYSAAYSPDGRQILTAGGGVIDQPRESDNSIRVWDAQTGQQLISHIAHDFWISSAKWSSTGQDILTASGDWTAKILSIRTGMEVLTLKGHQAEVMSVSWSPSGNRIATASADTTAKVWDIKTGKLLETISGHQAEVMSVGWGPSGNQIATASADTTAKVWDIESGEELFSLGEQFSEADYKRNWLILGPLPSADLDFDFLTEYGGEEQIQPKENEQVRSSKGSVLTWKRSESTHFLRVIGRHDNVTAYAYCQIEADKLKNFGHIGAAPNGISVWINGHQVYKTYGRGTRWMRDQYSFEVPKQLRQKLNRCLVKITHHSGPWLFSLRFSGDGHKSPAHSVAYIPSGHRLVTASADRTAKVWDATTGRQLFTLQGHVDAVNSVACSPDSSQIVTGSSDKTAKVWDATTGQQLFTLRGHNDAVTSVAWSTDGKLIATTSKAGATQIYTTQIEALMKIAEGRISRELTAGERKKYFFASVGNIESLWTDIAEGDEKAVRYHLDRATDINAANGPYGFTPLMLATFREQIEIVNLLVSEGADVNAKSLEHITALQIAALCGFDKIATLLVRNGADMKVKNIFGSDVEALIQFNWNTTYGVARKWKAKLDRDAVETGRSKIMELLNRHNMELSATP